MKNIALVICCLFCGIASTIRAQDPPLKASEIDFSNVPYPFPVKKLSLYIQGQQLYMVYMDEQPQSPNGRTVLLLHGKNFSGIYWEQTARDLLSEGYRVVIPDQIGFGRSSKATDIQYTFQLLAQNTRTLLDELKIDKVCVLGHSMGGMLAVRFALMYPERTEKLILENPIGLEDWKTVIPYQSVDDWYVEELKQTYDKMKAYQQESYYGGNWKKEYEPWLRPFAGWTLHTNYPIVARCSALTYDMIFTQPVIYELEQISVPTLLIIGQRDRTAVAKAKAPETVRDTLGNYPLLGKRAAERIPRAVLKELPGIGHLPHVEAYPQFIAPLKEFLAR